jgi:hypothetical protein
MLHELDTLSLRMDSIATGIPIIPQPPSFDTPDISHIDHCLQLIEFALLSNAQESIAIILSTHRYGISLGLVNLLRACEVLERDPDRTHGACRYRLVDLIDKADSSIWTISVASHCLISTLRLLVYLADRDHEWVAEISKAPSILSTLLRSITLYQKNPDHSSQNKSPDHGDEADANRLDVMCLALALLTTLVAEHPASRLAVFSICACSEPTMFVQTF